MLIVIFATIGVIVRMVGNAGTAVLAILAAAAAELAVFIPFAYRHARRTREIA
jgi:hypothetical protein